MFIGGLSGCTALAPYLPFGNTYREVDTNHDGYVAYHEFKKTISTKRIAQAAQKKEMTRDEYLQWQFARADSNRDGKVSVEEHMIHLGER